MYETYLQNEREFDEKYGYEYPRCALVMKNVEVRDENDELIGHNSHGAVTPNEMKSHNRLSLIKVMKALEEELEGEKWGSPYINGDFTHKHEEAYHHNAGLQLSLDKIREFIKLLEKGV